MLILNNLEILEMNTSSSENFRRVLGRVTQRDVVGRTGELERIMAQAKPENEGRGLLLLMEPSAGVSELLRQAYDQIFNQRSEVIPIYFAITRNETTAVSAAIEFLNTFVQQYIAYRRDEPVVSDAPLTLQELLEKADRKSTRLNSSHLVISYAVFCLKKKIDDMIYKRNDLSEI